jgi:hypothetical protein
MWIAASPGRGQQASAIPGRSNARRCRARGVAQRQAAVQRCRLSSALDPSTTLARYSSSPRLHAPHPQIVKSPVHALSTAALALSLGAIVFSVTPRDQEAAGTCSAPSRKGPEQAAQAIHSSLTNLRLWSSRSARRAAGIIQGAAVLPKTILAPPAAEPPAVPHHRN